MPITKLPENYAKVIGDGGFRNGGPGVYHARPAGGKFVVLQVTGRRARGDVKYEDVRDRIREQLGQQLAIRRYLDRLRKATYVEIRS